MPSAAEEIARFCREVVASNEVWTVVFADGLSGEPAFPLGDGRDARPFWSSHGRVARMLSGPYAGRGFQAEGLDLAGFRDGVIPACGEAGRLIGVNWPENRPRGYMLEATELLGHLERAASGEA